MKIEAIRTLLERLHFPKRYLSDQTAICIMALADKTKRPGLLPGHKSLSNGARIHDILNFARDVIGKKVAENTREAYRKTSLAHLMNYGLIVRHQLSTNDPNTYYRLHPEFAPILNEMTVKERDKLIAELQERSTKLRKRTPKADLIKRNVLCKVDKEHSFSLSPGKHNLLEKAVVELLGHAFLDESQVVYLGDTAPRRGYQNRQLMRNLNLPIDTAASLPDVILFSAPEARLLIVEVVTSSGPVNAIRLEQLQQFTKGPRKLGNKVSYISAFPSRAVFRKFVEDIAWGSSAWIEDEPHNIVHFEKIGTRMNQRFPESFDKR